MNRSADTIIFGRSPGPIWVADVGNEPIGGHSSYRVVIVREPRVADVGNEPIGGHLSRTDKRIGNDFVADVGNEPIGGHDSRDSGADGSCRLLTSEMNRSADTELRRRGARRDQLLTSEMNRSADTANELTELREDDVADVGNEPIGGHYQAVAFPLVQVKLLTSEMNRSADTVTLMSRGFSRSRC